MSEEKSLTNEEVDLEIALRRGYRWKLNGAGYRYLLNPQAEYFDLYRDATGEEELCNNAMEHMPRPSADPHACLAVLADLLLEGVHVWHIDRLSCELLCGGRGSEVKAIGASSTEGPVLRFCEMVARACLEAMQTIERQRG